MKINNFLLKVLELVGDLFWIANTIYAFKFLGFWYGLLNMLIPYAIIADIAFKNGRF